MTGKKQIKIADQYECVNANPKKPPEGETLESLEEKRLVMIIYFELVKLKINK